MNELSMEGKVVLISGGTRGIGFATVKKFLDHGAKVALLGSRKETVDKALSNLPQENVLGFYPDLQDYNAVKEMVSKVHETWGHIDILINNAGISDNTPFENYTPEIFEKVMGVNVSSVFNLTNAILPYMKEQGKGVILNTSSMVSIYGQAAGVAYPTSKFALNGFTKSLSRELGKYGIRVNGVAPGVTKTDMVEALNDKMVAYLKSQVPLQELGEAEDIANAFLFLASDMASYITGVTLSVNGGIVF